MRRGIVFMVIVMLMSMPIAATGVSEDAITRRYSYTDFVRADIDITSGTATCIGSAKASSSSNTVSITMKLQKKDGTTWSNVASWSTSSTGYAAMSKSKAVDKGYDYRVKVSGYIKDSGGRNLEPISATSNSFPY